MDKREFVRTSARGGIIVAVAVALQFSIGLVTQVALARMLDPVHFGQLALVTMAAMLFNCFTSVHGDKFVIRENEDIHRKLDNVFTLELTLAAALGLLAVLCAPPVMRFLGKEDLTTCAQFLALTFFYNPMIRPRCLRERELSFSLARFPLIGAQLCAAIVALTLAYLQYGVWSVLWWRISTLAGEVIIHWIIASYRPRFAWDPHILRAAARFGWPLMVSAFLTFFYYNIDRYIIVETLDDAENALGYYCLAFQAGDYFLKSRQVLYNVLFPVFSRIGDIASKGRIFCSITHCVGAAFLVPSIVMIFFGSDIVRTFLGSKWEPSVFPFQVVFVSILVRAIHANTGYFLYSHGITRADLDSSLIYSVVLPPVAYFMTKQYGINGTALAVLIVNFITVSYVFERYIRPLVGSGVLHFFGRPCAVAFAAFGLMYVCSFHGLAMPTRVALFVTLAVMAHLLVIRRVLGDLQRARSLLRRE